MMYSIQTEMYLGSNMRKFGFYLAPRFSMMSLLSMTEPLRAANEIAERQMYEYTFFGDFPGTTAVNGMTIATDAVLPKSRAYDAVIVCASYDAEQGVTRKGVDWLRWLDAHGVTLGSADTGAHIVAATGIWGDTPVALHWFSRPAFEARHPNIKTSLNTVEFATNRMSCAGATTGIDMMLHVIKHDHGLEFAAKVANHFIHNNGKERESIEQTALSELLRGIRTPGVRRALQLMEEHTETKITVSEIARLAEISPKQLERQFKAEVNDTPSRVYQQIRLARANVLLRQTNLTIEQIANACGFTSRTQFAAAFRVRYGSSPSRNRNAPLTDQS